MNSSEIENLRQILQAELGKAMAELELRLVNRFAPIAVEVEVESLRRWRAFTRGALTAISVLATAAVAVAGLAVKIALG